MASQGRISFISPSMRRKYRLCGPLRRMGGEDRRTTEARQFRRSAIPVRTAGVLETRQRWLKPTARLSSEKHSEDSLDAGPGPDRYQLAGFDPGYIRALPLSNDPARDIATQNALSGPYTLRVGLLWWATPVMKSPYPGFRNKPIGRKALSAGLAGRLPQK